MKPNDLTRNCGNVGFRAAQPNLQICSTQLIESLLLAWQRKQHQQAMLAACLALDEQASVEDDAEWEQAAVEDAIATAQLKQAIAESDGFITAVELLAMRSTDG